MLDAIAKQFDGFSKYVPTLGLGVSTLAISPNTIATWLGIAATLGTLLLFIYNRFTAWADKRAEWRNVADGVKRIERQLLDHGVQFHDFKTHDQKWKSKAESRFAVLEDRTRTIKRGIEHLEQGAEEDTRE